MDSLNFISPSDTVFFLETYDFEIGTSYGMVWNKHKSISYEYFKDKITFTDRSVFDDMIIDLVGRWNVEKLKIYGEKSTLVNPFFIYASRAIVEKNKINVDCIAFNEFFFLNKPN